MDRKCKACNGEGYVPSQEFDGYIAALKTIGFNVPEEEARCQECDGEGYVAGVATDEQEGDVEEARQAAIGALAALQERFDTLAIAHKQAMDKLQKELDNNKLYRSIMSTQQDKNERLSQQNADLTDLLAAAQDQLDGR